MKSPVRFGEADIVLGFEPLENVARPVLPEAGRRVVFSSTDRHPAVVRSAGREVARGWTPWNRLCVIALPPRTPPCRRSSMGIEIWFRPVRQQHPARRCGGFPGLLPGFEALEEGTGIVHARRWLFDVNPASPSAGANSPRRGCFSRLLKGAGGGKLSGTRGPAPCPFPRHEP